MSRDNFEKRYEFQSQLKNVERYGRNKETSNQLHRKIEFITNGSKIHSHEKRETRRLLKKHVKSAEKLQNPLYLLDATMLQKRVNDYLKSPQANTVHKLKHYDKDNKTYVFYPNKKVKKKFRKAIKKTN